MKRHLNLILKIITILAIVTFVAAIFITSQKQDAIRKDLKTIIASQKIESPKPKDGKSASIEQVRQAVNEYIAANPIKNGNDGQDATDEQVQQAVNNYLAKNPVKSGRDGKDGSNGSDGVTVIQQIRCNAVANRWETRYSPDDNWQLLNGDRVKCTVGGDNDTHGTE